MIILMWIGIVLYLFIGFIATFMIKVCHEYQNYNVALTWLFWPFVLGYIFYLERKMWFPKQFPNKK